VKGSAHYFRAASIIRETLLADATTPEQRLAALEMINEKTQLGMQALQAEQAVTPEVRRYRAIADALDGDQRDYFLAKAAKAEAKASAQAEAKAKLLEMYGAGPAPDSWGLGESYRDRPPPRPYDIALQRRKERGY